MCFFLYFSFLLSFLFFCMSFLDWDPLKSCVMMCFGILFLSCYLSLGVHVWYAYFIILVFLSGVFSLLTYFCSMSSFVFYYNYYYFFFLFSLVCFLFFFSFGFDFFFFYCDFNFLVIYCDFNYYYIFWIVFVLILLLSLASFGFSGFGYMRGL